MNHLHKLLVADIICAEFVVCQEIRLNRDKIHE